MSCSFKLLNWSSVSSNRFLKASYLRLIVFVSLTVTFRPSESFDFGSLFAFAFVVVFTFFFGASSFAVAFFFGAALALTGDLSSVSFLGGLPRFFGTGVSESASTTVSSLFAFLGRPLGFFTFSTFYSDSITSFFGRPRFFLGFSSTVSSNAVTKHLLPYGISNLILCIWWLCWLFL